MNLIDKDSIGTILVAWAVSALILFLVWKFIPHRWLNLVFTVILVAFMLFITYFLRVPTRTAPEGEGLVTSVADGKVAIVEKVFEKEFLNRECIQVSVYMNFFDVHCNFYPAIGEVSYYKYHPGRYLLAFHPKSPELAEHAPTFIATPGGPVLFKQIAGTFARRIVCHAKVGNTVSRGDQCGVIKFGSRIDMFLPLDADIKVKVGDKVRAVESVLAVLR